jgi:hypothetical protein
MVLGNLFDKACNLIEGSVVDCGIHLMEILAVCLWVQRGDPSVIISHFYAPEFGLHQQSC